MGTERLSVRLLDILDWMMWTWRVNVSILSHPQWIIGSNMFNHIHDDLAAWISKLERCPHVNTALYKSSSNTIHGCSCSWPFWRYNKPVSRIMGSGNITFFTLLRMSWHVPPPKDCHDCHIRRLFIFTFHSYWEGYEGGAPETVSQQLESTIPNKVQRSQEVTLSFLK